MGEKMTSYLYAEEYVYINEDKMNVRLVRTMRGKIKCNMLWLGWHEVSVSGEGMSKLIDLESGEKKKENHKTHVCGAEETSRESNDSF